MTGPTSAAAPPLQPEAATPLPAPAAPLAESPASQPAPSPATHAAADTPAPTPPPAAAQPVGYAAAPPPSQPASPVSPSTALPPRRATPLFMVAHPARWLALGLGSGLSPKAPGTVGTLWAWAAFLLIDRWLDDAQWALLIGASLLVGWWACTRCAQHLRQADPGAIVWDEVVAFWTVLWLLMPAGVLTQAVAFGLFRYFDAAKPGPVRWADRRYKLRPGQSIGWRQGWGIMLDDLVAALCTLLVIAIWRFASQAWH